jgi:two-component system chemotaxis response regulator CheY
MPNRFEALGGIVARSVLIVDDSKTVVQQMTKLLEASGNYKVVGTAPTADQAVTLYVQLKPDLVTMDIIMPGGDAIGAIDKIVKMDPKARIVVVSSVGGIKEKVVAALSAGAKNVIVKPFDKEKVLQVLNGLA